MIEKPMSMEPVEGWRIETDSVGVPYLQECEGVRSHTQGEYLITLDEDITVVLKLNETFFFHYYAALVNMQSRILDAIMGKQQEIGYLREQLEQVKILTEQEKAKV